jgi:hypothetical protein
MPRQMKVEFKNDRVNLHVLIKEETSTMTRVLMILFNVFSIAIVIFALIDWLLGLFMLGLLLTIFSGWLTLFHCYGNEKLIMSSKMLSFQYRYGFYTTPLESKRINRALNISLTPSGAHRGKEQFNLIFETYNDFELPEEIYRTRLSITKADFGVLKRSIRSLYFEKVNPEYLKQTFILN